VCTPGFSEDTPLSACSSVCLSPTENAYTHNTHNAHNSPWSGPVDGVIWRAASICFVLFSSFVQVCFKGERGRGSVCSFSILYLEYRYSLSPSPSFVFLPFFFFKNFVCASRYHMPSSFLFLFSFLRLASPLDSLVAPRKETPPARSPVSISYRTVLYYNTYSPSPSNRPTNQPHLMVHSMYSSDRKAANSSPRSSPMMCTQYFPSINITH
jgi:hypothetical protein